MKPKSDCSFFQASIESKPFPAFMVEATLQNFLKLGTQGASRSHAQLKTILHFHVVLSKPYYANYACIYQF